MVVGGRMTRTGAALEKTKVKHRMIQLGAVVDVDVVQVLFTPKFVEGVIRFVGLFGRYRKTVNMKCQGHI